MLINVCQTKVKFATAAFASIFLNLYFANLYFAALALLLLHRNAQRDFFFIEGTFIFS